MKRFGTGTLVFMFGVGMIALGGCGGSDGAAPSSLPQSAASYMGSSSPSVIDSTTAWNYEDMNYVALNAHQQFFSSFPLDSGSTGTTNETTQLGNISGTFTYSMEHKTIWDSNGNTDTSMLQSLSYSDWQDTTGTVLKANGDASFRYSTSVDLGDVEHMEHTNYNAFAVSSVSRNYLVGGYASSKHSSPASPDVWVENKLADIGNNDFVGDIYFGLLDASSDADYDGSVTTLVASGEYCEEGTGFNGCFDYEMNLQWDGDQDPASWPPDDGTIKVSTVTSSAMYDYSYAAPFDCFLYSVDADNNNAYEYTTVECD